MDPGTGSGWLTGKRAFIALSVVVGCLLLFLATRALDLPRLPFLPEAVEMDAVAPATGTTVVRREVYDAGAPPVDTPCRGEVAFRSGDYATAYAVFARRAGEDPGAAYQLGVMYRDGLGVARNGDLAVRALASAADAGHREAMTALGDFYVQDTGAHANYMEALVWYAKAAERGDDAAQWAMASMHADGRGTTRDPVTALAWVDVLARGYRDAGAALPVDAAALRRALAEELDNKKTAAAHAATEQLLKRIAVARAQFPDEVNPCAP